MPKRFLAVALIVLLLAGAFAYAAGGTASDPIVTLSYIQQKFLPALEEKKTAELATAEPELQAIYDAALAALAETEAREVVGDDASTAAQIEYEATMLGLENGLWRRATAYTEITLNAGERLIVAEGGELRIQQGAATLAGERATAVVDTDTGSLVYASLPVGWRTRYVVASDGVAGAEAPQRAVISVLGDYQIVPALRARHTDAALALGELGVLKGTNKGLELERSPTRLEALIMFLRLIGEEDEALAWSGSQPFTDLPAWNGGEPERYVGYAYEKGYTNGVSADKFGSYDAATLEMYLTFILRALGYSDADGDFNWVESPAAAVELGVITAHERTAAALRSFSRDETAYLSWRALDASCKDGTKLADKLIAAGAFTAEQYTAATAHEVRILAPLDLAAQDPATEDPATEDPATEDPATEDPAASE